MIVQVRDDADVVAVVGADVASDGDVLSDVGRVGDASGETATVGAVTLGGVAFGVEACELRQTSRAAR